MGTSRSNNIAATLFGTVRQRVLALLFGHTDHAYYQRQITRAVDAGHGAVQRELKQLVDCELLTRTRRGNQVYYQANEASPVFPELRGLILKTTGLADVLQEALQSLTDRIELGFVFGSLARGEASSESDVDLMIIGEVHLRELVPAVREATAALHRAINPVTMDTEELRRRLGEQDHFLTGVLERPKIFVIGDEDHLGRLTETTEAAETQAVG